ncbi:SIMPL domain-containing protein [Paracoccus sp. Z118]|uniref:SIMPL domain-containing protein n=1 Tax=Paracoccus sp. Z118 TaxID=2851017 RepID=UPI001C2B8A1F|nr:SIMPL domain-containing protein [Paracoccus sp. Z118]MBV0892217.1 SIMPL domain-containing protein [Paracoccus sp. Z118]
MLPLPLHPRRAAALKGGLLPLIALLALAPLAAEAHSACGPQGAAATLTTQGEGTAQVQPDMATVSVGVTVQAPTAAQAMADNATRQQAVIDALRLQGVEDRDIQTSNLNLSPVHDYSQDGRPPVVTGYQAQNIVTVTVRDLTGLGAVLDRLVSAGANEVQGIGFGRDDLQGTEDEARRKAVESARHRAEVLADAAGLRLGRLVSLSDGGGRSGPVPVMRMAMQDSAAAPTPIAAGELSVTAQVGTTYELVGDAAPGTMGHCGHGPMHGHGMPGHHGGMSDGGPSQGAAPAAPAPAPSPATPADDAATTPPAADEATAAPAPDAPAEATPPAAAN